MVAHSEVFPDLSKAWSPIFNGRAVVALASDPKIMERTGQVFKVDTLAREYNFTDVDGRSPGAERAKPGTHQVGFN